MAGHVLILDLSVRESRAAVRAPVDDAAALVDEALVIELTEGFAHGAGTHLVHGEAVALPVAGDAETLLLFDDAAAVLVLPGPDTLKELLAPQVIAGQPLGFAQLFLHADLGGDAGVILAREPECGIALHALIAGEYVLKRRVQRVTHMQLPRNVGWGHDDGKGLFLFIAYGVKPAAFFPEIVDPRFHGMRIIHFRQFFHDKHSHQDKNPP